MEQNPQRWDAYMGQKCTRNQNCSTSFWQSGNCLSKWTTDCLFGSGSYYGTNIKPWLCMLSALLHADISSLDFGHSSLCQCTCLQISDALKQLYISGFSRQKQYEWCTKSSLSKMHPLARILNRHISAWLLVGWYISSANIQKMNRQMVE